MKFVHDLKPIYWIIIAAVVLAGFMTAPGEEATKLAVLGKVAEKAGEDSGAGLMGQASVASMMGICMTFAPLVQQGAPESGDSADRQCRLVLRIRDSTRALNLGVANVAFLNIENAPAVVCLGAIYSVKCLAFGGGANFFEGRPAESGDAASPGVSDGSSKTLAEQELEEMRSRPREAAGKPFEFSAATRRMISIPSIIDELKNHLFAFVLFYNHQRKLKALGYRSPYAAILETYDKNPKIFNSNPCHKTVGQNNLAA